jgi:hypothetical protein
MDINAVRRQLSGNCLPESSLADFDILEHFSTRHSKHKIILHVNSFVEYTEEKFFAGDFHGIFRKGRFFEFGNHSQQTIYNKVTSQLPKQNKTQ